ncbi:recombinase family protein [Candidatus Nitrotoga sp. M5]|uniref:recombinase family protein n=1 Tax=Candidatus Nitrotoga sp. M5 TaxID=2890409 RepID=UPI001EF6EA17|nr:recombinase family protein [Candidatus Nitrotoga sp. M5]CAH1388306.1 e14 prophage; site-specific DNA recombinase [Candidatus Nitrotoga sp. M5]
MIIGYARVSTADQNTALQIDALNAAGAERIYQESQSGVSRDRLELAKCIDTLRSGDTLIVWRLDRLGRSLKDLVAIIAELEGKGVGFRSITEAIDTTTAGGKLVFHIFGSLAEFERSMIQERTKAGLAAARARGRKGGRPRALSADQVKKANAMLSDPTITKTEVAKHFKITRATLNAALGYKPT